MIGIYKIENKINNKIYIGQSHKIEQRWKEHIAAMNKTSVNYRPLYRAFKKYGINNFDFSVIETCTPEQLDAREQYWIQYYNSFFFAPNSNGYNLNLGGNGAKIPYEKIEQISLLWNSGLTTTEIANQLSLTKRTVQIYLASNCKNYTPEEGRERGKTHRVLGKKVNQYDLKGNFIKQYINGKEACKENNLAYEVFKRVVKGDFFAGKGFIYIYDNEDQEAALKKHFQLREEQIANNSGYHTVEQYDLETNETIATFESYADAARQLFYPEARRYIGECCRGKRAQYQGYGWRDKND